MTREEIIKKGRPLEPYCFETDREETWYGVGLYDGAMADTWISVKDNLPAPGQKVVICVHSNAHSTATVNPEPYHFEITERIPVNEIRRLKRKGWHPCDKYGFPNHGYDVFDVIYWMPIPELPKGGEI